MQDKYFHKKEKLANLLFDLVKYLLTTVGALLLLSEKSIRPLPIIFTIIIAAGILTAAILITPIKEDSP